MAQKLSQTMGITATMPPHIFNEIEARATAASIGKSAILRQIVVAWYNSLSAKDKAVPR